MDDPVDALERLEQRGERGGVCQSGDGAWELELLVAKRPIEGFEQQSAEQGGEHSHGEKESGFATDPLGVIGADPASGHDTVDVGMKEQILSPGVENGEEPDFSAEAFRVGGDGLEGGGRGFE